MHVHHMHALYPQIVRGCHVPRNRNSRCLWPTTQMMAIKLGSSVSTNALNHGANSLAPGLWFLNAVKFIN